MRNLVCSDHVNTAAFAVELHLTVGQGKKGVIFTAADTHSGMYFGATLANDDVTSDHGLSAEFFYAEALAA